MKLILKMCLKLNKETALGGFEIFWTFSLSSPPILGFCCGLLSGPQSSHWGDKRDNTDIEAHASSLADPGSIPSIRWSTMHHQNGPVDPWQHKV